VTIHHVTSFIHHVTRLVGHVTIHHVTRLVGHVTIHTSIVHVIVMVALVTKSVCHVIWPIEYFSIGEVYVI